jgi:hypothetical protein
MIKQQCHEAPSRSDQTRYTLIHVSRSFNELGYYESFREIEESGRLDFVYIPAVSRPTTEDRQNPRLGAGRANNLIRRIFGMPLKEEEDLQRAKEDGGDGAVAARTLEKVIVPELPARMNMDQLRKRLSPEGMVLLSCGNPHSLADIGHVAKMNRIRFEREEW